MALIFFVAAFLAFRKVLVADGGLRGGKNFLQVKVLGEGKVKGAGNCRSDLTAAAFYERGEEIKSAFFRAVRVKVLQTFGAKNFKAGDC